MITIAGMHFQSASVVVFLLGVIVGMIVRGKWA